MYKLIFGIVITVEFITAVLGIFFYAKYKHIPILKYFIFLLWYTLCKELTAYYFRDLGGNNALINNISHFINFTYLLFLYLHFLKDKSKYIVRALIIIYILVGVVNGFYENYLEEYQSTPYIIGASFLIVAIILYFIEILNSKKVLYTDKILLFWISFGLLLYYVGTIPFRILLNYYESLSDATVHFFLNFSLTIIMNIFFIIGFIWSSEKQQG